MALNPQPKTQDPTQYMELVLISRAHIWSTSATLALIHIVTSKHITKLQAILPYLSQTKKTSQGACTLNAY